MKVIGVGNLDRGDDAIGALIAESIAQRALPGVSVEVHDGDGASLIESWKEETHVIVIDCACSGSAPGTIHHFCANDRFVEPGLLAPSTHAFGIAEAIELSRALQELPETLEIYAIEGSAFDPGSDVSAPVQQAAATVIRQILQTL